MSGLPDSSRISDSPSNTTCWGLTFSTAVKMAWVVSPSSVSDGWNTDASVSPARLTADLVRSHTSTPSSFQPWDAQVLSRSRRDSVRVMYRHESPALTRLSTYWRATVVLPEPGSPWTR